MTLTPAWPLAITVVMLAASTPTITWAQRTSAPLGGKERAGIIDRVATELERRYVFPDTARSMARALRERQRRGDYDRISSATELADSVTAHLQAVSGDRHLRVAASPPAAQDTEGAAPSRAPRSPDGLEEVKTLDGNIGYMRFGGFAAVERVGARITGALGQLASTDALIIDLRDNRGGSPTSVMYLAGYLFPDRTLIARIYSRPENDTSEMWTASVPGVKYLNKDVFVLTNRTTFSAAEAAAYHLQAFGRAAVVGDTTGGGAHRVVQAVLNDRMWMWLPITRPINARTGTDWEGVGVIPDIAAPSERALVIAQLAALRKLPSTPERSRVIAALAGNPAAATSVPRAPR